MGSVQKGKEADLLISQDALCASDATMLSVDRRCGHMLWSAGLLFCAVFDLESGRSWNMTRLLEAVGCTDGAKYVWHSSCTW